MAGGFSVHDQSGGFQGDLSQAMQELAERDSPTPPEELTEHERMLREEAVSQEREMRDLQKEAVQLREQAEAGLGKQRKAESDKAQEHWTDPNNFFYSNGELYAEGPNREIYHVQANGQRVRVKGAYRTSAEEFAAAEKEEMDRAFAAAKKRKAPGMLRD